MNSGHNSKSLEEQRRDQQFGKELKNYDEQMAKKSSAMGEIKAIYQRAGTMNIPKAAFAFAKKLQNGDVDKVKETLKMQLWVMDLMGFADGLQTNLFGGEDADPKEVAYQKGYFAGLCRTENAQNPFEGDVGQAWAQGFNDGNEKANTDLAAELGVTSDDDPTAESAAEETDADSSEEAADEADDNVVQMNASETV